MMIPRNKFSSQLAFGKKFFLKALNEKGEMAIRKMLEDKPSAAESELIKISKEQDKPLTISYLITNEEFKQKIEDVSEESAKKARRVGIKKYDVKLQVEMLKKNMTTYNVLDAIYKNLSKYGATLFDIEVWIK
jgi:hypothetical protein